MTDVEALELAIETLREKAETLSLSERAVRMLGSGASPADRKNVRKRARCLEAITELTRIKQEMSQC